MIHKENIDKYQGSMLDLAEEIGDLRYDSLSEFLDLLQKKIHRDADKDNERGRLKLSTNLYSISASLLDAKKSCDEAWIICKPYMNN